MQNQQKRKKDKLEKLEKNQKLNNNDVASVHNRYIKRLYKIHYEQDNKLKLSIEIRHANNLNVVSKLRFINNSLNMYTNTMSISMFSNNVSEEKVNENIVKINIGDQNFFNMISRRDEMLKNIQTNVHNLFETKIEQLNIELNTNHALNINNTNNENDNNSIITNKKMSETDPNSIINDICEIEIDNQLNESLGGKHFSDLVYDTHTTRHLHKVNLFLYNSGKPSLSTHPVIKYRSSLHLDSSKLTDSTQMNSSQQLNKKNNNSNHKERNTKDSQLSQNTSSNLLKG